MKERATVSHYEQSLRTRPPYSPELTWFARRTGLLLSPSEAAVGRLKDGGKSTTEAHQINVVGSDGEHHLGVNDEMAGRGMGCLHRAADEAADMLAAQIGIIRKSSARSMNHSAAIASAQVDAAGTKRNGKPGWARSR